METPQIFPSNPTPSYVAPYTRSVTVSFELPVQGARAYSGRFDNPRHNRQVVQALFDEQTDDAVGIEDEIAPGGVLVPDDGVQRLELRSPTEREYGWRGVVLFVRCGAIRGSSGGRHGDGLQLSQPKISYPVLLTRGTAPPGPRLRPPSKSNLHDQLFVDFYRPIQAIFTCTFMTGCAAGARMESNSILPSVLAPSITQSFG